MKRILMCGVAAMALASAASAEGYISGNYVNDDTESDYSVNARFLLGQHVLVDGGYTSLDGDTDVWHFGGHVFGRGENWLLGVYAGYETADSGVASVDGWNVAAEGQYYEDRVTLSGTVSFGSADFPFFGDVEVLNIGGGIRYFVTDNFSLEANAAYLGLDAIVPTDDGSLVGLGAEYQFDTCPLSIFAGYRHTELSTSQDTWGIGLRWNFGEGTLLQRDRSGARLNRPEGVVETLSGGGSLD